MTSLPSESSELRAKYLALDHNLEVRPLTAIKSDCLIVFPLSGGEPRGQILIDTDEFTAVCPWTGLPDTGSVKIVYTPANLGLELKSLKYYLMSYTLVGIIQEEAARKIYEDIRESLNPRNLRLQLDYTIRGGIHTLVVIDSLDLPTDL